MSPESADFVPPASGGAALLVGYLLPPCAILAAWGRAHRRPRCHQQDFGNATLVVWGPLGSGAVRRRVAGGDLRSSRTPEGLAFERRLREVAQRAHRPAVHQHC